MKNSLCFLAIYFYSVACAFELADTELTSTQLIVKYGYTPEIHYVTTEDGYILQLHRIVKGPHLVQSKNKVVFLMHGLPSTSADYLLAGPKTALGYYLFDLGFDVWMGNARGNRYSRNHTSISPEMSKFWEFSWHEIGIYDLPASIDYILYKTNHQTLSYIGFSQGTTAFFVMCSERPEYQSKINLMQALSPVTFFYRTPSTLLRLAGNFANRIEMKLLNRPPYEYLPNTLFIRDLGKLICSSPRARIICTGLLFEIFGYDPYHINDQILVVLTGHLPAGASNWNIAHYGQLMDSDRFGQFDFGRSLNMIRYGQATPPDYKISNITVPIMLIYSPNDKVSHPKDVLKFRDSLPNLVDYFEPTIKDYNHLDYIIATDVRDDLYPRMVQVLIKYSRN